jgi:hypothetical protein
MDYLWWGVRTPFIGPPLVRVALGFLPAT